MQKLWDKGLKYLPVYLFETLVRVDTVLRVKREEKENLGQKVVEISAHQRPGVKVCAYI
jgi:hypothetical protein